MNFQQLRIIREAIRNNLNLTEVAAVLHTAQSGVSKHIKDLEEELGIELFVRKGKRLTALTPAGQGVVQMIERILLETENLKRYASHYTSLDKGRLVVAATDTQGRYALPRVAAEFTELFPNVLLELRQGSPKHVAELLTSGDADIGLVTETLDEFPDLETFTCFSWQYVAVVPRGHPLAERKQVTLADIASTAIITYNEEFSGRAQVDAAFERAGLIPDIRLTAVDTDVLKSYVRLGLGVGILDETAMEADRELVILDTGGNLFEPGITRLALRRTALLRSFSNCLIGLLAPDLPEVLRATRSAHPAEARSLAKFKERATGLWSPRAATAAPAAKRPGASLQHLSV
jgi:LysR family cys regulon transcriptional activator